MTELSIPLFPLKTVLFPGGPLPLRIFEPRYLDMVSACLKHGTGVGICLIREGSEVGAPAQTYDVGTLSHISYWNSRPDGLLGITVRGEQRFRILSRRVEPSQLIVAQVQLIPNEPAQKLPAEYASLAGLLRRILEQLGAPYSSLSPQYEDAVWVGYRLVELLPLELAQKQYFLQLQDARQRLARLAGVLDEMGIA